MTCNCQKPAAILLSLTVVLPAVLLLFYGACFSNTESPAENEVFVVPIRGTVDPGMVGYINRAYHRVSDVSGKSDNLIVFEMDSFGGRVDSALEIVDTLLKLPKERTTAFVSVKAISAGALIALACGDLAMKPGTTIGDCAPISFSSEGPQMMGEKFQSPLRAKFRALAKRNGYPERLAEAMVTSSIVVYKVVYKKEKGGKTVYMDSQEYDDLPDKKKQNIASKVTVIKEGELLTMENEEAVQLGFSKMTVSTIDELLKAKGLKEYRIIRIEETWSEALVRFIGKITPILMMLGLAALYTEMKAPGFGLPGILGISCLALVFLNQYLVGLAGYTEFLIIIAGLILIGIELFALPGFGVAGYAGFMCMVAGMVLVLQDFVIPDPSFPWQQELLVNNIIMVLGSFLVSFFLALFILRYVMPKVSVFSKEGPYLTSTLKDSHADSKQVERVRTGNKGVAQTPLRPSGRVTIDGEVFDVTTNNEFMEKGANVIVSEIKGNRIIVSRQKIT